MYKIFVPVMNNSLNSNTRNAYLDMFIKAKAQRVFLFVDIFSEFSIETVKENVDFLSNNGIEPALWISSIGHGGPIVKESKNESGWIYIKSFSGENIKDVYCPLDQNFTDFVCQKIATLCKTGVKKIMLDDDFRISQHATDLCCLCELHLQKISDILGEKIDAEILKEKAFIGGENKYRSAYLKAMGDSLKDFAKKIRFTVDKIDKTINLSVCSCWSAWDADGVTAMEICQILAGDNPKFLRLHGAPYWAIYWGNMGLTPVIETAKMFASFCHNSDVEIFSEGDTFPRSRYKIPASYLELYDTALRLDGSYDGMLKYMFDYNSSYKYESGYLDFHVQNYSNATNIQKVGEITVNDGVRVYVYPNTLSTREIFQDYNRTNLNGSPYSAGNIFALCSIPTTYEGVGVCPAIFGENARHISKDALKNGAILDAVSAKILHESGVDVGIDKIKDFSLQHIRSERFNQETVIIEETVRFMHADYKKGVKTESYTALNASGNFLSFDIDGTFNDATAYKYENANGQKFFVLCFSLEETVHKSVLKCSYERQLQLVNAVEWISGKKLPAITFKHPETYVIAKRNDNSLTVGVFNCFADYVLNLKVNLDQEYKAIKSIVGDARLDKDTVTICGKLPAFSYAVFTVEK